MKTLVIVESPAKAKTIEKYLGKDFRVIASFGHVRDLPKDRLAVDVEKNFEPTYIVPTKSRKTVQTLKGEAAKADQILMATDPDREGEAISWHIMQALKLKDDTCKRVVFHEITENAIKEAVAHPRCLDTNLVDAQQARRVLDRLVGYTLSPLLWKKVRKGLSAGRVQSVAVKLVVDREREIEAFVPQEYWDIRAHLSTKEKKDFEAKLFKIKGEKYEINNEKDAAKVKEDLENAGEYLVTKVESKDVKRNPYAPFITSTLQQDAARKLRYTAKRTMMIAQGLYEGVELGSAGHTGLITYMRTDSTNLSGEAITEIRKYIENELGKEYLPKSPRIFKKKSKNAQEAHEAIRATSIYRTPESVKEYLAPDQFKLYELIWKRTIASQMNEAVYAQTSIDITAGDYTLRANGRTIKFDGFMKVYLAGVDEGEEEGKEEYNLPLIKEGEKVDLKKVLADQKFTEPPARYNEATLIKALEEHGVGRPSTYATIISTIQDRGYVSLENRRFIPGTFGFIVTDLLVANFPEIVDIQFTAHLEDELDDVAGGEMKWQEAIKEFWVPFKSEIDKAGEKIEKINTDRVSEEICDKCGKPMVIKQGRFGEFLACTGFPECKNTRPMPKAELGIKCPKCEEGDIVERRTKRGKVFYGCSRYPECDYATWDKPTPPPTSS